MVPPLKTKYDSAELPLSKLIFNRESLFKDYMTVVKDEENYDMMKSKNQYYLNEKFSLIVLSNMQDESCDDEIIQMVLDELPNED
eukprot:CAMPEP_0168623120 /NCGR_PEP_ID=MMETSP0449_2-20121227/8652_1 /TAXON_ID=1082188 /ORGANISM="Strombidium rassoulzadegani, Strain ras09" /LENGTH=84 /DNA_ID=CAMNT_0008664473 /DNA_START=254 /DNA_END=505 /DNA_ORIENTATION=-